MLKKGLISLKIIICILAFTPFVLFGLLFRGDLYELMPIESYMKQILPQDLLLNHIDSNLNKLSSPEETLIVEFNEDELNTLIYGFITQEDGINPFYAPFSDCDSDVCNYISSEAFSKYGLVHINGIWIRFEDDQIQFHLGVSLELFQTFTFSTILFLTFDLIDDPNHYQFNTNHVKLGHLTLSDWVIERFLNGIQTESMAQKDNDANDSIKGIINSKTHSYTILKSEIVLWVQKSEHVMNPNLSAQLLKTLFDYQWMDIKIKEDKINFNLKTPLIFSEQNLTIPSTIKELYESDLSINIENLEQGGLEQLILFRPLLGDNFYTLIEQIFNTVMASRLMNNDSLPTITIPYQNSEGMDDAISIFIEGIWAEISSNEFNIQALFEINNQKSLIEILLIEVPTNSLSEMTYDIERLTIGKNPSDLTKDVLTISEFNFLIDYLNTILEAGLIQFNESDQIVIG